MPEILTFGRYQVTPFTWVMACPSKEKQTNKKGEVVYDENGKPKRQTFKRRLCYIYVEFLTPSNDGMVWVYTGTGSKNKPLMFSDSRDKLPNMGKPKRLSPAQVESDIASKTSAAFASEVMEAMVSNHHEDERGNPGVAKQEVADLLGCTLVPVTLTDDDGEEYETTRFDGGLPARIQDYLLTCKGRDQSDRKLKRR